MPLVGTRCCQGGTQPFDYCLRCARGGETENCVHPLPLIKFMAHKEKGREGAGLSATGIISCARQNILLTQIDYYEDPDNVAAAFRGEIWHDGFEKWLADEPDVISERRLKKEVSVKLDGEWYSIWLSGKPDQVYPSRRLITDTKSVSKPVKCDPIKMTEKQYDWCKKVVMKQVRETDEAQLNIYAWLYRGGVDVETGEVFNIDIDRGGIIYIGEGGRAMRKLPATIWGAGVQDDYVAERVLPRIRFDTYGEMPPVLPIERIITARNTGRQYVKRHWKCDWCPVRAECDELARFTTGLDPNEPEYWADGVSEFGESGSEVGGTDGIGAERNTWVT